MQKIFKEYGGVIVVAMSVVALIMVVAILLGGNGGGIIGGALRDIVDKNQEVVGGQMDYIGWRDYDEKYDAIEGGAYYKVLSVAMTDANAGNNDNGTADPEGAVAYVKIVEDESILLLLTDTEATETLPVTNNVVFNLRGNTLSMGSGVCFKPTAGNFTLLDHSREGVIVKTADNTSLNNDYIVNATSPCASVTIDGGTYDCDVNNGAKTFIGISSQPALTMSHAKFDIDVTSGKTLIGARSAGATTIESTEMDIYVANRSGQTCGINVYSGNATIDGLKLNLLDVSNKDYPCEGIQVSKNGNLTVKAANILVDGSAINSEGNTFNQHTGQAIGNYGTLTLKGDSNNDIHLIANREAIQSSGNTYIYNGIYEGSQHGGIYAVNKTGTAEVEILGGTFKHIKYWGDNPIAKLSYLASLTTGEMLYGHGAAYFGGNVEGNHLIANISNATFIAEDGRNGVVVKSDAAGVYNVVNLTDCKLSGYDSDLRVDDGQTANVYGDTVFKHNTIDERDGGTVNDNR